RDVRIVGPAGEQVEALAHRPHDDLRREAELVERRPRRRSCLHLVSPFDPAQAAASARPTTSPIALKRSATLRACRSNAALGSPPINARKCASAAADELRVSAMSTRAMFSSSEDSSWQQGGKIASGRSASRAATSSNAVNA